MGIIVPDENLPGFASLSKQRRIALGTLLKDKTSRLNPAGFGGEAHS